MNEPLKRISLLIRDDQHQFLADKGINLSGLVRDLLDDYLSEHKLTLTVSEETRGLYDQVVAHTGASEADVEPYLKEALKALLRDKIKAMQDLQKSMFGDH